MRANCRSSCELCSTTKKLPKKEPAPTPGFPECKRMTVGGAGGVGATGKMRGRRTYCSERYSEDLVCNGRAFDFARLERGRDSWDIIEREVSSTKGDLGDGEPRVVFQGPNVSEATHNTAFLCNDDGTVSAYGGRIKATSRFATAHSQNFYHEHFPGLQRTVGTVSAGGSLTWSHPELVLDEEKARHLLCLDMRKGVEVCEFDDKLSAVNYRGNTFIFGRANVAGERDGTSSAADSGGRHVQVTSHPIGKPGALEAFTSLHFEGYSTSKDNNIYFMAVKNLKDEVLVGLMPAIIDGASGIFLSHSVNGMLWSKPQLIMESEAVGPRTRDFPVDGFVIEEGKLAFSVDHNIYLDHDDACDAPPFTCSYEVVGAAYEKLLGRKAPAAAAPAAAAAKTEAETAPAPGTPASAEAAQAEPEAEAEAEAEAEDSDEPCQHGIPHKLDEADQIATDGGAFACCPAACGACSGAKCEDRPGGASQCCAYGLVAANEPCRDATSVACIVPGVNPQFKAEAKAEVGIRAAARAEARAEREALKKAKEAKEAEAQEAKEAEAQPAARKAMRLEGFCSAGLSTRLSLEYVSATQGGAFACCPKSCGACGGGGCEELPGGTKNCCAYGLVEANVRCTDENSTACIVLGKEAFAKEFPQPAQLTNALEAAKVEYTTHVADTLRRADVALAKDRSARDTLSKEIKDAMEVSPSPSPSPSLDLKP